MKVSTFDKSVCVELRMQLQDILNSFAESMNLDFTVGNISFTPGDAKITVTAKVNGEKGRDDNLFELKVKLMGFSLKSKDGSTLVGYKKRAYKRPWIFHDINGKPFSCDEKHATKLFKTNGVF